MVAIATPVPIVQMAEEAKPLSNLPELVPPAVFMEDVNAFMQGGRRSASASLPAAEVQVQVGRPPACPVNTFVCQPVDLPKPAPCLLGASCSCASTTRLRTVPQTAAMCSTIAAMEWCDVLAV